MCLPVWCHLGTVSCPRCICSQMVQAVLCWPQLAHLSAMTDTEKTQTHQWALQVFRSPAQLWLSTCLCPSDQHCPESSLQDTLLKEFGKRYFMSFHYINLFYISEKNMLWKILIILKKLLWFVPFSISGILL